MFTRFTFLLLVLWCGAQGAVVAADSGSVCPDMSQHQEVLNQGQQYYERHGTIGGDGGFDDGSLEFNWERPRDDSPCVWPEFQIDQIVLKTAGQIASAEFYARTYEQLGLFDAARKMYTRIIEAQKESAHPALQLTALDQAALARVKYKRP